MIQLDPTDQITLEHTGPIILVDDEKNFRNLFEHIYADSTVSLPLRTFSNGPDFLSYLDEVESGEAEFPSLVILDVQMEPIDGLDVLEDMRSRDGFQEQPKVVILTASSSVDNLRVAEFLEANAFYIKKHGKQEYLDILNAIQTPETTT